jgi:prepilin-type N-terminal cleavage/methylation domain-containing protein
MSQADVETSSRPYGLVKESVQVRERCLGRGQLISHPTRPATQTVGASEDSRFDRFPQCCRIADNEALAAFLRGWSLVRQLVSRVQEEIASRLIRSFMPKRFIPKQKGFSLIELLIVVAIILIIAAIAIPNLLRARMAANEASAVASLRTINTAEVTYNTGYPTVGYATALVHSLPD